MDALSERVCPALEKFFNEHVIEQQKGRCVVPVPQVIDLLRNERGRWQSLQFTFAWPLPEPIIQPDGRGLLRPGLLQTALRAGTRARKWL